MQKFIIGSALTLILGFTACQHSAVQPAAPSGDSIAQQTDSVSTMSDSTLISVSLEDFEKYIAKDSAQLLDVRTPEEYANGHIKGSYNVNMQDKDFVEKVNKLLNKENIVAIYCRSGRRSKIAAKLLASEGYQVVELNGGFNEWKDGHREIEK